MGIIEVGLLKKLNIFMIIIQNLPQMIYQNWCLKQERTMEIKESYTFDDLLLTPQYSEITSRSNVDTSVNIAGLKFSNPIIPANMQTIISYDLAIEVIKNKGLAILHRFMPILEQLSIVEDIIKNYGNDYLAVSLGVLTRDIVNLNDFVALGVKIFCIDIAHGDSKLCLDMIEHIKAHNKDLIVIAGNVATGKAATRLWQAGADVVKVGIGGGSICLTRINTANGVPQMSAIMDVYEAKLKLEKHTKKKYAFISDGGIRTSRRCCKSLLLC